MEEPEPVADLVHGRDAEIEGRGGAARDSVALDYEAVEVECLEGYGGAGEGAVRVGVIL